MPNILGYVTHKTAQGDTFDALALTFYAEEKLASLLIQANPDYCSTLVFDAGVELSVPVVDTVETPNTLPPWRREA